MSFFSLLFGQKLNAYELQEMDEMENDIETNDDIPKKNPGARKFKE